MMGRVRSSRKEQTYSISSPGLVPEVGDLADVLLGDVWPELGVVAVAGGEEVGEGEEHGAEAHEDDAGPDEDRDVSPGAQVRHEDDGAHVANLERRKTMKKKN